MTTTTVTPSQRATRHTPCVICGGSDGDRRGRGERCWGYISANGRYAYCSQDDGGGSVKFDQQKQAYVHFLAGPCFCGKTHGAVVEAPRVNGANGHNGAHPAGTVPKKRYLFTEPPRTLKDGSALQAEYLYPKAGRVVMEVLRYERSDPDGGKPHKTFHQAQPLGDGRWAMDLNGVTRVLYYADELAAAPSDEWVSVPEGEKCVGAMRTAGCVATCASGGAGKWSLTPNAAEAFRGRRVIVLPDNDGLDPKHPEQSYVGQRHAKEVADDIAAYATEVRVLELPGLPVKGDIADWLAGGGTKAQLLDLAKTAPLAKDYQPPRPATPAAEPAWETPLLLAGLLPPVEQLDMDMLPAALRGFVWDIAERQQVPVDYPAVALLVAAGAIVGRRIGIHPKQQDDWIVTPTPWGGLIGPSGWGKTPAMVAAMKPLERLIAEASAKREQAKRDYEADKLGFEAQKAALVEDVKQAARNKDASEVERLKGEVAALQPPTERKARRYRTSDATVEKLAELLIDNPSGILAYRDELMGWLRTLDKQGHETDRAFYIEAWGGTSTNYEVDRIGRGSIVVPALCMSVLGGIQPGPLRSYVYAASDTDSAGADGLLQRFQLLVWPDAHTEFKIVDRWPNKEAKTAAYGVIQRLATLDPADYDAVADDETDANAIPCLRFNEEAQQEFYVWWEALERRIRSGDLSDAFTSHLSKYRSLMPALALLFHLIDCDPSQAGYEAEVGLDATLRAISWCEYLETHAVRVYASATNPDMERAGALLKHLKRGDVADLSMPRDIYVHGWEHLQTAEEVEDALSTLEAYGWLRIEPQDAGPKGGRPTKIIHLHPSLCRRCAQGGEDGND